MNPPEQLRILERLLESDGWKWLEAVAKAQVSGRTDEIILKPLKDIGGAEYQEYLKGEISGIRLFMSLPVAQIANLRAQTQVEETTDDDESN